MHTQPAKPALLLGGFGLLSQRLFSFPSFREWVGAKGVDSRSVNIFKEKKINHFKLNLFGLIAWRANARKSSRFSVERLAVGQQARSGSPHLEGGAGVRVKGQELGAAEAAVGLELHFLV